MTVLACSRPVISSIALPAARSAVLPVQIGSTLLRAPTCTAPARRQRLATMAAAGALRQHAFMLE